MPITYKDAKQVNATLQTQFTEILNKSYTDGIGSSMTSMVTSMQQGAFSRNEQGNQAKANLAAKVAEKFADMPMTDAQIDAVVGAFRAEMSTNGQKPFGVGNTIDDFAAKVDTSARKNPELNPVEIENKALKQQLQASFTLTIDNNELEGMVADIRKAGNGEIKADAVAKAVGALKSLDGETDITADEVAKRQNVLEQGIPDLAIQEKHIQALQNQNDPKAYAAALAHLNAMAGRSKTPQVTNPEIHIAAATGAQYAEATKGKNLNPKDIDAQMISMTDEGKYAFFKAAAAKATDSEHKQYFSDKMAMSSAGAAKVTAAEQNLDAATKAYTDRRDTRKATLKTYNDALQPAQKAWEAAHTDAMKPFAVAIAAKKQQEAAAAKKALDAKARAERIAKTEAMADLRGHMDKFKAANAELAAIEQRAKAYNTLDAVAKADPANQVVVAYNLDQTNVGSHSNAKAAQEAARSEAAQKYAADFAKGNISFDDHTTLLSSASPEFQKAALDAIKTEIASAPAGNAAAQARKAAMEAWHADKAAAVEHGVAFDPKARAAGVLETKQAVAAVQEAMDASADLLQKQNVSRSVHVKVEEAVEGFRKNPSLGTVLKAVPNQQDPQALFEEAVKYNNTLDNGLTDEIKEAKTNLNAAETRDTQAKARMADLMKNVDPKNPDFSSHDNVLAAMNPQQRQAYLGALNDHTKSMPGLSGDALKNYQEFRVKLEDRTIAASNGVENDPDRRTEAEKAVMVAAQARESAYRSYFRARENFEATQRKAKISVPSDNSERNRNFQETNLGSEMFAQWQQRDTNFKEAHKVLYAERAAALSPQTRQVPTDEQRQAAALKIQSKVRSVQARVRVSDEVQQLRSSKENRIQAKQEAEEKVRLTKEKSERAEEFKKLVSESQSLTGIRRSVADGVWVGPLENQLRDATSQKSEGLANLDDASAKVGRVIKAASEDFDEVKVKHLDVTNDMKYLEEEAQKNMRARVTQGVLQEKRLNAEDVNKMAANDPRAFADLKKEVDAKVKEAEKAHKAKVDKMKDNKWSIFDTSYQKMEQANRKLQEAGNRLTELDEQQKAKNADLQAIGSHINRLKEELALKAEDRKWYQLKDKETKDMEQQLKAAREERKLISIEMRKVVREVDKQMKDYAQAKAKYEENYPKVKEEMKAAMSGPDVVAKGPNGERPEKPKDAAVVMFDEKVAVVTKAVNEKAQVGQSIIARRQAEREAAMMKRMTEELVSNSALERGNQNPEINRAAAARRAPQNKRGGTATGIGGF